MAIANGSDLALRMLFLRETEFNKTSCIPENNKSPFTKYGVTFPKDLKLQLPLPPPRVPLFRNKKYS